MIKSLSNYQKAVGELIIAGFIWGMSFIFVSWALKDFSAYTLVFWRFVLAFILGEALLFIFNPKGFKESMSDIRLSFWSGLGLGSALMTQTSGLNYTTATNSSFITSLYVVMIPIVSSFVFKNKVKVSHFFLALLAFLGMALLLNMPEQIQNGKLTFNKGDLITILTAITSTMHIICVSLAAPKIKNGFRFNTYQTFWALLLLIPFLIHENNVHAVKLWPDNPSLLSIMSILGLALFVSMVAFYLQVRAQKVLTAATASMLCLLEAPFAFLFALFLLNESLNLIQSIGALIILLSSALSVIIERPKDRKT